MVRLTNEQAEIWHRESSSASTSFASLSGFSSGSLNSELAKPVEDETRDEKERLPNDARASPFACEARYTYHRLFHMLTNRSVPVVALNPCRKLEFHERRLKALGRRLSGRNLGPPRQGVARRCVCVCVLVKLRDPQILDHFVCVCVFSEACNAIKNLEGFQAISLLRVWRGRVQQPKHDVPSPRPSARES